MQNKKKRYWVVPQLEKQHQSYHPVSNYKNGAFIYRDRMVNISAKKRLCIILFLV